MTAAFWPTQLGVIPTTEVAQTLVLCNFILFVLFVPRQRVAGGCARTSRLQKRFHRGQREFPALPLD